jgi:hypothetical protein
MPCEIVFRLKVDPPAVSGVASGLSGSGGGVEPPGAPSGEKIAPI